MDTEEYITVTMLQINPFDKNKFPPVLTTPYPLQPNVRD